MQEQMTSNNEQANSTPRVLPHPPAMNQTTANHNPIKEASEVGLGISTMHYTLTKFEKENDFSDQFFTKIYGPDHKDSTPFEKIPSKSFGTDVDFVIVVEGHLTQSAIKLILDVYAYPPDEIEIHVNAYDLDTSPIGHLSAYTKSRSHIVRQANGELSFDVSNRKLIIRDIEVSRSYHRKGVGRRMASLLLGQALAYDMSRAEVYPCPGSDGALEDGRDRTELFWAAMGFNPDRKRDKFFFLHLDKLEI